MRGAAAQPPPPRLDFLCTFRLRPRPTHGCQMATAIFFDRMCLALQASGLWLRYATLQNLIPSFLWIAYGWGVWGRNFAIWQHCLHSLNVIMRPCRAVAPHSNRCLFVYSQRHQDVKQDFLTEQGCTSSTHRWQHIKSGRVGLEVCI